MTGMKIYVCKANTLAMDILADEFELVTNPAHADYGIAWKADLLGISQSKTVMFQTEPPITRLVQQTYMDKGEYLRFFGFPEFSSPWFPYMPIMELELQPRSGGEGIYFAGMARRGDSVRLDQYVIYGLRVRIAATFRDEFGGVCLGKGWEDDTKSIDGPLGWHDQKFEDIKVHNPKYVLSIENTRMPGYITEKFWDGILSGKPMIYLGAPDILERVPSDIFIDLGQFCNGHDFDMDAAVEHVESHSDDDLLQMAERAETWLHDNENKPREEQEGWTREAIKAIKQ